MRKAWLALIALTLIIAGSTVIVLSHSHATPRTAPVDQGDVLVRPSPPPTIAFTDVSFSAWALLDRRTGSIIGSPSMADQGDTMSMIKAWIAADYLRDRATIPERDVLKRLSIMIRDSDNDAAVEFHRANGESTSIDRMVLMCDLTETHAGTITYRWSDTVMSARDVARLGACIAEGTAAGPWTAWLLTQMRGVRGEGDFGPRQAFAPQAASAIAIKNGWFMRPQDGKWHYACLAIADTWTLGVLLRYPQELGPAHGEQQCQAVGTQLMPLLLAH